MKHHKVKAFLASLAFGATLSVAAQGQILQPAPLDAPKPKVPLLTKETSIEFSALAGAISLDALSTQRVLSFKGGHERDPLAKPFVQTRALQAFGSGISFASLAFANYELRKHNHPRLARIGMISTIVVEAFLAGHNYLVVKRHEK